MLDDVDFLLPPVNRNLDSLYINYFGDPTSPVEKRLRESGIDVRILHYVIPVTASTD